MIHIRVIVDTQKAKNVFLGKFDMTVIQAFIQHATLIKHYTANQTTLCPEAIESSISNLKVFKFTSIILISYSTYVPLKYYF